MNFIASEAQKLVDISQNPKFYYYDDLITQSIKKLALEGKEEIDVSYLEVPEDFYEDLSIIYKRRGYKVFLNSSKFIISWKQSKLTRFFNNIFA